jgi:hypothetical protein
MDEAPPEGRLFTVEEANALLPRVREMMAQLGEAHGRLVRVSQELESLERRRDRGNILQLARELREARERLGAAVEARRAAFAAIAALGVQIKSLDPALIDFPSLRDGRVVLLCWRAGEPAVMHWHDLDSGFAGRRPL